MSTYFRENWTDNVSVVAAASLSRGAITAGTLDLRTKKGATVMARVGRQGTNAIDYGVKVIMRPILNNGTATPGGREAPGLMFVSFTEYNFGPNPVEYTMNVSASSSGQKEIELTGTDNLYVGSSISIQSSSGSSRVEFARISKLSIAGGSGVGVTLDRNLQYTHTVLNADRLRSLASIFNEVWLYGGALWEVIFDYGQATTGDAVTVCAFARTLNYHELVTV